MLGTFMSTTISPGVSGGTGRSVPGSTMVTSYPGLARPQLPRRTGWVGSITVHTPVSVSP